MNSERKIEKKKVEIELFFRCGKVATLINVDIGYFGIRIFI